MNEVILRDLRSSFGISVSDYTPVSGGYLNQKWRASTNQGELLIKQYNHVRFNARKREEIEYALRRQILLSELGVRCPRVFSSCGQVIRCPDQDTSYMVRPEATRKLPLLSAGKRPAVQWAWPTTETPFQSLCPATE